MEARAMGRLDMLLRLRKATGLSMDWWECLTQDLSESTLARLVARAEMSPK